MAASPLPYPAINAASEDRRRARRVEIGRWPGDATAALIPQRQTVAPGHGRTRVMRYFAREVVRHRPLSKNAFSALLARPADALGHQNGFGRFAVQLKHPRFAQMPAPAP